MVHKENYSNHKSKKPLIVTLVVLFMLAVCATVFFYIPFSYSATEVYYVREPYTSQECSDISLKFAWEWKAPETTCINNECSSYKSVCTDTNFWGNCLTYSQVCQAYKCTKYEMTCNVEVTNVDDTVGTWIVSGYSIDGKENREFVSYVTVVVQPSKSAIASWKFQYDADNLRGCTTEGVRAQSSKQECQDKISYNTLQKERTITKQDTWYNQIMGKTQYVFYEQENLVPVTA